MNTLHILHAIDSLDRGGAERMLVDIANATVADGKRVSVCVTRHSTTLAAELNPEIKLWVLKRYRRFDWAALRYLSAIVREQEVSLIHAHGTSTFALLAFAKTLRLLRVPIILHDHNGSIETNDSVPFWMRWWGRYFIDSYVGVYSKLGEWAKKAGISPDRVFVIGNVLDFQRLEAAEPLDLRQTFGLKGDCPVGIAVAGLRPDKAIDILLEAAAQVAPHSPFYLLIIGGDRDHAYADACRQQCVKLGLSERVIFTGERSDIPAILKSADFGVLPSRSESGPLILIEFLIAGLPFVASKVGDIGHRVAELGVPGFAPPNDATALADALDSLLKLNANARRARGQIGLRIAKQHFNMRRVMPQWYEVYNSAIEKGR